ncbi:MAG: hypothetical protein NTU97_01295 [Candidatus Magasanikbacteria bacterium]|nr:hypothetical protein [Candidatus Magasanikbacteria bacterium]
MEADVKSEGFPEKKRAAATATISVTAFATDRPLHFALISGSKRRSVGLLVDHIKFTFCGITHTLRRRTLANTIDANRRRKISDTFSLTTSVSFCTHAKMFLAIKNLSVAGLADHWLHQVVGWILLLHQNVRTAKGTKSGHKNQYHYRTKA